MNLPARGALLAAALAASSIGAGCGRPSGAASDAPAPGQAAQAPPAPPPLDHLAPDELVEGTEQAFGIALPRGLVVERRSPDVVSGTGPMTVHALAKYLRPRLKGGGLRESERVATFEHVTTAGLPPGTELTIRLTVPTLNRTRLEISTVIHPPAPVLPDVASRWRQVGLTPEGKVLDPMHLD